MSTDTDTIRKGVGLRLSSADEMKTKIGTEILRIATIRRDGGTQARTGNSEETVALYAEAMRESRWHWTAENAVVVFRDPEGQDWLADGFHRVEAALRAGWPTIEGRIHTGTRRDAILYAAGANAQHGLRRTQADVRRAIETLLRDEEWVQWSDRAISRKVRCDHKTVGAVRDGLASGGEIPHLNTRTGSDGKSYTQAAAPLVVDERAVSRNGSTYQQAPARPATPQVAANDSLADVAEALRRGNTRAAYV